METHGFGFPRQAAAHIPVMSTTISHPRYQRLATRTVQELQDRFELLEEWADREAASRGAFIPPIEDGDPEDPWNLMWAIDDELTLRGRESNTLNPDAL